ncbi:MAG: DEAD/DEAH box helicase [Candidatus Helarchaeota archaeon]
MKSVFNLKIEDIPLDHKFVDRFKERGFTQFFPPQALGALIIFKMPIVDEIVEFNEETYAEYHIPHYNLFYKKVKQVDPSNPPLLNNNDKDIQLRDNFLFCIPTGVGKTLLGMLLALKSLPFKTIWCFTLKAIANEKYIDFKELFGDLGVRVGIKTGDYSSEYDNFLKNYDWIVATPEAADSLLTTKPSWLSEVKLVVLDEIHMVRDPDRGFKYEDVVAKSRYHNFNLVGLSATVSNAVELAQWLEANLIFSDWRMVPLKKGVIYGHEIYYTKRLKETLQRITSDDAVNAAINFLKKDEQVLCFIDSRMRTQEKARKCMEVLKTKCQWKPNIELSVPDTESVVGETLNELVKFGVAFHMAGLSLENRKAIEDLYRAGLIRAIWATPTLAAGVNLPAKRVIQDGYKRASRRRWMPLPVIEMHQRWGRAGRPQYDKLGYGYVVARKSSTDESGERLKKEQEIERLFERYVEGRPEPIQSKYLVESNLYCSLLRCIRAGYARTINQLLNYYKLTLSNIQHPESKEIILEAIEFLIQHGFLKRTTKQIRSTQYGNLTADLYIHPQTALTYSEAISLINDRPDPLTLIFIVCMAPDAITLPVRGREESEYRNYYESNKILFPLDIIDAFQLRAVKTALVLDDYKEEVPVRNLEERYNINIGDLTPIVTPLGFIPWLFNALAKIAAFHKRTALIPRIEVLSKRITYGVKEERLPLIKIRYVSRARAIALQDAGFNSIESIANAKLSDLQRITVKGFKLGEWAEKIKKSAKECLRKDRELIQEYSPEDLLPPPTPLPKVTKRKPTAFVKQKTLFFYD